MSRNQSITRLTKIAAQENIYLREKQFAPLFSSLKDIESQHKKVDKKIAETIDILTEIESILEELKL